MKGRTFLTVVNKITLAFVQLNFAIFSKKRTP